MSEIDLSGLAEKLVRLSQNLVSEQPSVRDIDGFYRRLDDALNLAPAAQRQVLGQAMIALHTQNRVAAQRLREEIELECEMQYLQTPQGYERAAVLFALPVVAGARSLSVSQAQNEEALQDLVDGLTESDVVHFSARCALSDHLWTLQELHDLAPGEVRALTRRMGQAALRGERVISSEGPGGRSPLPGKRKSSCMSSSIHLFFVVGVACVPDEALDDVFPALPDETDINGEDASESSPIALDHQEVLSPARPDPEDDRAWHHTPGELDDGRQWEDFFYEQVQWAFSLGADVLGTQTPSGFFEDLLSGQQTARRIALLHKFGDRLAEDELFAEISPCWLKGRTEAFSVELHQPESRRKPLRFDWPVLDEEDAAESLFDLQELLDMVGVEHGDDSLPSDTGLHLLH